jgi:hypothetical protein
VLVGVQLPYDRFQASDHALIASARHPCGPLSGLLTSWSRGQGAGAVATVAYRPSVRGLQVFPFSGNSVGSRAPPRFVCLRTFPIFFFSRRLRAAVILASPSICADAGTVLACHVSRWLCQGVKESRLIDQARLWRPHARLPPAMLSLQGRTHTGHLSRVQFRSCQFA